MTAVLLARGSRFGDIRPVRFRGSGGFSDVYEAYDSRGRKLALKVLRLSTSDAGKSRDRFERELKILSSIDSRSVARLIAADFNGEQPWIASEYVDGPTLREAVDEQGPLSSREAVQLLALLIDVIHQLHSKGIAHRDLTPNNVILGPDGPVLIDFGAAKDNLDRESVGSRLSVGTPAYASPEVLRGESVGTPADIFSLAKVVGFSLTGTDGGDEESTPEWLESVPAEIGQILAKALNQDPANRPDAGTLKELLPRIDATPDRRLLRDQYEARQLRELPRRFSPGAVVFFSLIAVLLGIGSATAVFRYLSSPPTVKSLLAATGDTDGESWTSTSLNGSFLQEVELPSTWEIERVRHIEQRGLPFLSTMESYLATSADGDEITFSVELTSGTWHEFEQRFDQARDRFETQDVPDGCTSVESDEPKGLDDPARLVGLALVQDCVGRNSISQEKFSGFVVQVAKPQDDLLLLIQGRFNSPIIDLARLLRGVGLTELAGIQTIEKDGVRAVDPDRFRISGENYEYFFGRIAVQSLGNDENLIVESRGPQDTTVSAFGVLVDNSRGLKAQRYVPLGRQWIDNAEDTISFIGSSTLFDSIVIEFESTGKEEPRIEIRRGPRPLNHELLTTRDFQTAEAQSDDEPVGRDWVFGLPHGGELSGGMKILEIFPVRLSIPTGWYVSEAIPGTTDFGFVANPASDFLSFLEDDDPQLSVMRNDAVEVMTRVEADTWLVNQSRKGCHAVNSYRQTVGDLEARWVAVHGCTVADAFDSGTKLVTQEQMSPIFHMIIRDLKGDQFIYRISYSAMGSDALRYWSTIVTTFLRESR